jgi:hypothetical protein
MIAPMSDTLTSIRRSFELFNEGRVEVIFEELLHPDIDYSADPDVSALVGSPADLRGAEAVRSVWAAFFGMFAEVQISNIELEEIAPGQVVGSGHMVARGGSSGVPIDAPYYFAWVVRGDRQTFMAAKLHREEAAAALADHLAGRR